MGHREITGDFDSLRPLRCAIESASDVSGHTEYDIRLAVPHLPSCSWIVSKRYNDFVPLHDLLCAFGLQPELPPKKAFGNKDREFIAERQRSLETYCRTFLENLFVLSSKEVKNFLHPGSKIGELATSAVQLMAMVFRTGNQFEITSNLPVIGWRSKKEFVTVRNLADPKQKLIGCWTFYGPDFSTSSASVSALLGSLSQTSHPLFYPILFADARDAGCVCVRAESQTGSLLDLIKNAKYRQPFLQKYARNKRGKGLTVDEVQRYGRQILETLKFFHDNSVPFGNLSSRNVVMDGGRARISEIENGLCGLRNFYWPYILQFRKISTFEAIDVYSFGHLLYEMVFGQPLEAAVCDSISPVCPPLVRAVLESILTPEACRVGMPTVTELLTQPLFHNVSLNYDPVSMKMKRDLKQALLTAKQAMEAKLVQEQKAYHTYRKEMKVHSFQSSEDERKKRRLLQLKSQISADVGLESGASNGRPITPTTRISSSADSALTPSSGSTSEHKLNMPPRMPPPPGPPPPPPPTPPSWASSAGVKNAGVPPVVVGKDRSALLESIRGFNKKGLSQAETVDKSAPIIS